MANQFTATFQLTGGPELEGALLDLGSVLGQKACRVGIKKAMQPVFDEIVSSAPINNIVQDGVHIRDCIKMKVSKPTKKMQRNGSDTFLSCTVYTKGPANEYACAVEFGRAAYTATRDYLFHQRTRPYQVHIAEVLPTPFMRTALYKHAHSASQAFIDITMAEIGRIAKNRNKIAQQKINAMYRRSQRP
ncbi:hypothetical protein [Aeromonas veronii]|uniref:hypothetical protein n=1 Tax=Aeromonas veronii TaxID=654 RepID=UPI003B9F8E08